MIWLMSFENVKSCITMTLKTKSLSGIEYELDEVFDMDKELDSKHLPEQLIISFPTLGKNMRLCVDYIDVSNPFVLAEVDGVPQIKSATITDIKKIDDNMVIKCVSDEKENKEKKIKYLNSVIEHIDFRQGSSSKVFVNMLSNVFTVERLKEILECDSKDIEILLFKALMYFRVKDRAYRL